MSVSSYAKLLYQLPSSRLHEIVRRRAATLRAVPRIEGKRELATFLVDALSSPTSIQEALNQTDLLQIQVLTYAIVQGGTVLFDTVVHEAGEEARERLLAATNELEANGLVILTPVNGIRQTIYVPNAVRQHTPLPLPLRHTLPQALNSYDATTLGVVYQALDLPPGVPTKGARMDAIALELTTPERLQAHVAELPEDTRSLLQHIVQQGGALTLSQIAARLDTRQRNQIYSYDWSRRWAQGKPRNPVEELLVRGLLVMENAFGWGYGHILIPGNVLNALTGRSFFAKGVLSLPEWQTMTPEKAGIRRHETLCRDIAYLLGFLGRTEATRTSKGNIHRTVLKALAKGLSIPLPGYAAFVYAMSREAELISPQGKSNLYDITTQGLAWLEQPVETQLDGLYNLWRVQGAWAEIAEDPLTEGTAFYLVEDARAYRRCALSLLTDLTQERPGELASLYSLTERAQFRWWTRFPKDAPHALASEESEEGETDGPQTQGALQILRAICAESLYWLGLTEVIGNSQGDPTHVRLSLRGRRLLLSEAQKKPSGSAVAAEDILPPSTPEVAETFIVQPNLEIYAPQNLAPRLLYRLFRVAEPGSGVHGILTLSKETLRRAMDRGETAEQLLKFLRAHSQTGVPQNVEYLIKEVGGRHGHIRIGQAGIYLQVNDPLLLKEIKAQNRLNIHFRAELADTVALVTGDSVDAILRQLRQAGYFPVSDEESSRVKSTVNAAPRRAYTAPKQHSGRTSSAGTEARIDWTAIAEEDNQPWEEEKPSAPTTRAEKKETPAMRLKTLRAQLTEAIQKQVRVEIIYQPRPEDNPAIRLVEPLSLVEYMLRARKPGDTSYVHYNINFIVSARLTDETF